LNGNKLLPLGSCHGILRQPCCCGQGNTAACHAAFDKAERGVLVGATRQQSHTATRANACSAPATSTAGHHRGGCGRGLGTRHVPRRWRQHGAQHAGQSVAWDSQPLLTLCIGSETLRVVIVRACAKAVVAAHTRTRETQVTVACTRSRNATSPSSSCCTWPTTLRRCSSQKAC
jgi:hypothetical protein